MSASQDTTFWIIAGAIGLFLQWWIIRHAIISALSKIDKDRAAAVIEQRKAAFDAKHNIQPNNEQGPL